VCVSCDVARSEYERFDPILVAKTGDALLSSCGVHKQVFLKCKNPQINVTLATKTKM
jgi:hypothetical protein